MSFKDVEITPPESKYFKLVDGENRFRAVSEPVKFWKNWDEKKTYLSKEEAFGDDKAEERFACWVINRANEKIKPFEFGKKLMSQMKGYANDSDYGFDGLPPYDFKVMFDSKLPSVKRTGDLKVAKESKLTDEELASISTLGNVLEAFAD